jgi:Na+/melibiose symporter-like transporter
MSGTIYLAPGRMSRRDLLTFSSPGILFALIEVAWRSYLPSFFAATLAFPVVTVGLLLLAMRIFTGVIDPAIGWASDRFPTRFGLRRPWLAIGAPMIGIGAIGVFWAEPGVNIFVIGAWGLLLHLGHRLVSTPHGGWGLELASDESERVRIAGAKLWVGGIGVILVLLLPGLLEKNFEIGRAAQVSMLGGAILLLAPLTALLVLRAIPEPPMLPETGFANPLAMFTIIVRDGKMRSLLILYGLVGISDAASASTFLFFVDHVVGLQSWGGTLIVVQAAIPLATLPLWAMLSRRLDKERALSLSFAWQALATPLALLLPAGNPLLFLCWLILSNLTLGADYMLLRALVSDISCQELEQGRRWSASRYALSNVTLRLAMGAGAAIALGLLGWAGFQPSDNIDDGAQLAIRLVYVAPSSIAAILAVLILTRGASQSQSSTVAANGIGRVPRLN